MASTPSNNRLKLTPSNSPHYLQRHGRSPFRGARTGGFDASRLSLKRVVGTTCSSPTGFDTVHSSFAYIAGGAVVVIDVLGEDYSQRFYRARPAAIPVFTVSPVTHCHSSPNTTPKANDSRNRVAPSPSSDWSESPTAKTWTSRERIKAATCLGLSRDGRYLAVGETGYAPRVLIFSLQESSSSDIPLVSISEHTFGVNSVAWSPDTKYLASLGEANDGFLFLWKIDPKTGSAKLFQQNRCTTYVRGMVWMGNSLITFGVRHVKIWRVEEGPAISPTKAKFVGDGSFPTPPQPQKSLPGRNIVLGPMLNATFSCAVAIDDNRVILCTDAGDVCLLDDTNKQMKLTRVADLGFGISCVAAQEEAVHIGGKAGQTAIVSIQDIIDGCPEPVIRGGGNSGGLVAMGFLAHNLVTIDARRSIDIWNSGHNQPDPTSDETHISIPGHGDPIIGIQPLATPNIHGGNFFTWSSAGKVVVWTVNGMAKSSLQVPVEQIETGNEFEPFNQLIVVKATDDGSLFFTGDKLGVLRMIDYDTKRTLMDTKAHASDCHDITVYENKSKLIIASRGRDRTVQLFLKTSTGSFEHFQTLEFAAKVVQVIISSSNKILTCSFDRTLQVHDLVTKDGEPDAMAAIQARSLSLKASPTAMVLSADEKSAWVSLLDRSVCCFDLTTGRLLNSFKCTDEAGVESAVLESLIFGSPTTDNEPGILLAISNTDKSVRIYDAQTGSFLDREWGHTEAINGVILLEDADCGRKVVSVGSDGTIMIWLLDMQDFVEMARSRDPSPDKNPSQTLSRPPLRKVLSKAELAEFQRPSSASGSGRRSPPRGLHRRSSRLQLSSSSATSRSSNREKQPSPIIIEYRGFRRGSTDSRSGSPPPASPQYRTRMFRRPSLPTLTTTPPSAGSNGSVARKKSSMSNLRGGYAFGSSSMATEQTCRQLRAMRTKLGSSDPINSDVLSELDTELRLTAAALGERAIRSRSQHQRSRHSSSKDNLELSETLLSGLLDQYSERLVSLLDEKLRLKLSEEDKGLLLRDFARDDNAQHHHSARPRTAGERSSTTSVSTSSTPDKKRSQAR